MLLQKIKREVFNPHVKIEVKTSPRMAIELCIDKSIRNHLRYKTGSKKHMLNVERGVPVQ